MPWPSRTCAFGVSSKATPETHQDFENGPLAKCPPPTPSQVINNRPLNQSILHDLIVRLSLYSRTSIQATPGLPLRGRGWGFPLAIMNLAPATFIGK